MLGWQAPYEVTNHYLRRLYSEISFRGFSGERKIIVNAFFNMSCVVSSRRNHNTFAKVMFFFQTTKKINDLCFS